MTKQNIAVNLYSLIERAVEEGLNHGYRRAFKHTNNPLEEVIKEHIHREIMNALTEIIDFGD